MFLDTYRELLSRPAKSGGKRHQRLRVAVGSGGEKAVLQREGGELQKLIAARGEDSFFEAAVED